MDTVRLAVAAAMLIAAAPVMPSAPLPSPPSIKAGVERWRAGDYPAAVAMWQPFANAGDPDAMFNMGQAYKLGRGVPADAAVARDWYRKAATRGHLPAQANLGIALFQAGEKPEAIKWLRTAADRGEPRAQYVLGIAAFNGDGIPRSQALGYGYLLRSQASGLPQAATALGSIAPSLSPADRSAGEAVSASLAAGTGVPAALAAATASRLIVPAAGPLKPLPTTSSLPVRTPPSAVEIAAAKPAPVAAPVSAPARSVSPPPGQVAALAALPRAVVAPPTAPVVTTVRALPEPTPAQADTAARLAATSSARPSTATPSAPTVVATTDAPASKPVPAPGAQPAAIVAKTPAATPLPVKPKSAAATPLKPFEVVIPEPGTAAKPTGWRVQLGAFSARRLADAAWADVKATAAPAKPIFASDGPVTKLQMGPFATRDAAKAACAKLTEAGRACFVTAG